MRLIARGRARAPVSGRAREALTAGIFSEASTPARFAATGRAGSFTAARESVGRNVFTTTQLHAIGAGYRATEETVDDERPIGSRRGNPPVESGMGGRHRPQHPRPPLERGVIETELDLGLVHDLDTIKQIRPPRLVSQRVGIGAIDQVAPHIDRRDRARTVRPAESRAGSSGPNGGPGRTIQ